MRVSENQRHHAVTTQIGKTRETNLEALNVMSSLKKINTVYDDPVAVTEVIQKRSRLSDIKSYEDNVSFGKGFINSTEMGISQMQEQLMRAYELAIGQANDTYGPDSRSATAAEVGQLIQGIVNSSNSRFGNKFVFSGFRTNSPSVDGSGTFLGDDGEIFLQTGEAQYQRINIPGREIFEVDAEERKSGQVNMMDALISFKNALETNDKPLIQKSIDRLSFHTHRLTRFLATIGSIYNGLESATEKLGVNKNLETERLSFVEDADMFEASSDFKRTEQVLNASLTASQKVLQPSLLDYLK